MTKISQDGCQHSCTTYGTITQNRWINEWNIYSKLVERTGAQKARPTTKDTQTKDKFLFSLAFLWNYVKCTRYSHFSASFSAKPLEM